MAVDEGGEERLGVAPAVVHRVRLVSESGRSSVDLQVEWGRLVVSRYSGSWIFARSLELDPPAVLATVLGISDLVPFLCALIITPSSKDPSPCSHERDPLMSVDTVEAKSSAAAGPARRSAVATTSSSSSTVTLLVEGAAVWVVDWELRVIGPLERKLTRWVPLKVRSVDVRPVEVRPVVVRLWAPAARGPRLRSRAQSSAPAAGTMGLDGVGLGGRPGMKAGAPTFSPSLLLLTHRVVRTEPRGGRGLSGASHAPPAPSPAPCRRPRQPQGLS